MDLIRSRFHCETEGAHRWELLNVAEAAIRRTDQNNHEPMLAVGRYSLLVDRVVFVPIIRTNTFPNRPEIPAEEVTLLSQFVIHCGQIPCNTTRVVMYRGHRTRAPTRQSRRNGRGRRARGPPGRAPLGVLRHPRVNYLFASPNDHSRFIRLIDFNEILSTNEQTYCCPDNEEIVKILVDNPTVDQMRICFESLRRSLSKCKNPPVDEVIKSGLLDALVQALGVPDEKVQFEAAWALTNVVSGTSPQTVAAVQAGATAPLVALVLLYGFPGPRPDSDDEEFYSSCTESDSDYDDSDFSDEAETDTSEDSEAESQQTKEDTPMEDPNVPCSIHSLQS